MTRFGTMAKDVSLLGTSLRLDKGQRVMLTPATNLPQGGWFARPVDEKWPNGQWVHDGDSIHLEAGDMDIDPIEDVTKVLLVPDGGNENDAVIGIISRPTKERHSNANLWDTFDEVTKDLNDIPVGRYRFLYVCRSPRTGEIIYRKRTPAFDIIEC